MKLSELEESKDEEDFEDEEEEEGEVGDSLYERLYRAVELLQASGALFDWIADLEVGKPFTFALRLQLGNLSDEIYDFLKNEEEMGYEEEEEEEVIVVTDEVDVGEDF